MQLKLYTTAKPFLKWAGGKGQLIHQIDSYLPSQLKSGKISRYIEPFIGGAAIFFHIAQTYSINELIISDINPELILAYRTVKQDVEVLISFLCDIEKHYLSLDEVGRKEYFYNLRQRFNHKRKVVDYSVYQEYWIERTAQIIFLNRTCFNGLFRVNSKGEFNVPFGKYENPTICDASNLRDVSQILQRTEILLGDYTIIDSSVDKNTFVYFDPPYRPISRTSNFTSYSSYTFDDNEQYRLAKFYRLLDERGASLMLSNSDPQNEDINDRFFENLYEDYHIQRVQASRMINRDADKRGLINELLIINYESGKQK